MEFQQLRYFVAVARERHFLKAAESIPITQPTLSQQIKKLERFLGTRLFERTPRRVKLTPAGERFLPHAVALLDGMARAEADVRDRNQVPGGRIVLGAIPTVGPYVLPPLIQRIRREAPAITLDLHDLTTSVLLERLKEGRLDLGVLALPVNDKSIASRPLGKEPFYLAVGTHHPLTQKKQVSLGDLKKEQLLILQEGHCFRDHSLAFCKLTDKSPRIAFQGSSLVSVLRLAAAGEGVTFVPHMAAVPSENPGVVFLPFVPPTATRTLGVVWRKSAPLNRAQSVLIAALENDLRPRLTGPGPSAPRPSFSRSPE